MAKAKKNTLNDLSDFLKSGSTEITSETVGDDYLKAKPHTLVEVEKVASSMDTEGDWTETRIISEIKSLAEKNDEDVRFMLFRVVQKVIGEKESINSSDLMFTNMALYLEHVEKMGESYKEMLKGRK